MYLHGVSVSIILLSNMKAMLAIEFYVFLLRAYFFLFAILIGFLIYSDHHCLLIGIIYTYCDH